MFQPLPLLNHTSPLSPPPLPTILPPPHQLPSTLYTRSILCLICSALYFTSPQCLFPWTRSHTMKEHRPTLVSPHPHMCTPPPLTPTLPWTGMEGRAEYLIVKGTMRKLFVSVFVVQHVTSPHTHTFSGVFRFHAVSELAAQQLLSVKEPTHSTMGEVASR